MLAILLIQPLLRPEAAAAETEPSKPAVYSHSSGEWLLRDSLSGGPATTTFHYGRNDGFDINQMLCDWNGDGTETPGLRRRNPDGGNPIWLLRDSNTAGPADHAFYFGREDDRPVCGDWNGDGSQTPGVVRHRADGRYEWHLRDRLAGGPGDRAFVYGRHGTAELPPAFPMVGDWNGDDTDTPGLVRGRDDGRYEWLLRDRLAGGTADVRFVYFGGAVWGDTLHVSVPRVGDWNGDGRDTAAVTQATNGSDFRWYLRNEHAGGPADHEFVYGHSLSIPLVGR